MIKINGFKYLSDRIIHPKTMKCPKYIYKYYSLSDYNMDAFLNGYLFASHPLQLNDIKDSRHNLFRFSKKPDKIFYEAFRHPELYEKDDDVGNMIKKYFWKEETKNFGIVSLSTLDKNILMWPHYTQEKGFMIQFKSEELLSSIRQNNQLEVFQFSPMNYMNNLVPIYIKPNIEELKIAIYYMVNVKDEIWNYENEWRLFVARNGMWPPLEHPYYSDFNKEEHCGGENKRQLFYDKEKSIEKVVWGSDFIYLISESVEEQNDWIKFKLKDGYKKELIVLQQIEKRYSDKFYISFLREDKKKLSLFNRLTGLYKGRKVNSIISRCNRRFEIQIDDNIVNIRPTEDYN